MLTNKDYCDYETCVALKEKGFPQHITEEAYIIDNYGEDEYDIGERLPIPLIPDYMDVVAAPTLYEAQKWLREEKRVEVNSCYDKDNDKWFYYVLFMDYPDLMGITASESKYDSYEEALSEGIKEVVEILTNNKNE